MRFILYGVMALWLGWSGCSSPKEKKIPVKKEADLPKIVISAQNQNLNFLYSVDGREMKTETDLKKIPKQFLGQVVVIDLSKSPEERGAGDYVYLADLTKPDATGKYPYRTLTREAYEREILGKYKAQVAKENVILYVIPNCPYCDKARQFLKSHQIKFVEKDFSSDKQVQAELMKKGEKIGVKVEGAPVFDINGQLLLGFDQKRLAELLGLK